MTNEREAMLLAAADFLGKRPNANQDEIAQAVGVSRATLHRHFAGRAELMQALSDTAAQKFRAAVTIARPAEGDCASAVRRLVAAFEESAPYLALFYILSQEDAPAAIHPAWEEVDAAVVGLFERGQTSGEFTPHMSAVWMAEAFHSLIAGAVWAVQGGRVAQRDFTHMVTRMVLSGTGNHIRDEQDT